MALKNNQQRRQYFNNEDNWKVINEFMWFRVLTLAYGTQHFYRVDVRLWGSHFDAQYSKFKHEEYWDRGYIKYHIASNGGLTAVSTTEIIEILKEEDKKK